MKKVVMCGKGGLKGVAKVGIGFMCVVVCVVVLWDVMLCFAWLCCHQS